MTIFANCVFHIKVKYLPIQKKNSLKACIKENGGVINFVLNQECTHVLVDNANVLSRHDLKITQKYQLPVVYADFVWKSVEYGMLLPAGAYEVNISQQNVSNQWPGGQVLFTIFINELDDRAERTFSSEKDRDAPFFPHDFEVAKYSVLEKINSKERKDFVVIELQCSQEHFEFLFRLHAHFSASDGTKSNKQFIVYETAEEIRENYDILIANLKSQDFLLRETFPPEAECLASTKLKKLLLEESINSSAISQEVSDFVELIWAEALGHLDSLLLESVNNISLNDVSKAEGILLQVKNALNEGADEAALREMMMEFYQLIRHKTEIDYKVSKQLLSRKQDLCQLMRDMLNIRETSMSCPNPSSLAKYQALRCRIEAVDPTSDEFLRVKQQVLKNNYNNCSVRILQVYRVGRISETTEFLGCLGNILSLFHASSVRNFMGILSRGLLMPKVVVEDHGVERTDIGNLGSGIYFSDSISASIKYSSPSEMDGTRLLAVCDVALGSCLDLYERDFSLNAAPSDYDSVHGVRKTADVSSDFEDDEFVVYNTAQVKIRYVVKFCLAEDQIKPFQPGTGVEMEQDNESESQCHLQDESYALPSANISNTVKTGLQDSLGNPVPLEGFHIKARIIDFVAQVVLFQTYTNQSSSPIEAKYVFPLDDKAAVCGFEAFVNGVHIIGKVKEKKQAHREYRKAVSQGDGAYLMDQDAPDIFVVSVGNLCPNSTVLIKITYITELSCQNGCITFHLPASVSPWQQDKALKENTQDTIKKVSVKQVRTLKNGFSLDMSIEMPYSIERLHSWTHKLKIKKTECKAVIKTVENSSLDSSGFGLDIWFSHAYLPRMWVEKHPNKSSEACMLVFQPEFEAAFDEEQLSSEIVILLDCSHSMAGSTLLQAKQIALHALKELGSRLNVNVIKFGTNFIECSSFSKNTTKDLASLAEFITSATATLGNTDLWKTLRYLSLLFPSQGHRNILLISDGHIQNESVTFQIVKDNVHHTRLFTCGVGSTANRHMLRSLSQYGAGAFEYFDSKSKYNWETKIQSQVSRIFSPGCSSVSIKWQQFDTDAPKPMQAPAQIQSLFTKERLLVYGFVPHCTQATLRAIINDRELQTVVSTTELQKTTGTVLHKLTARAFIRDYEDGILHENETEHEMKKQILKNTIIRLSLENSIITQFTSFVAVEKRDEKEIFSADVPNILEIIAQEDVDFLPYMNWDQEPMECDISFSQKFHEGESNAWSDDFLSERSESCRFQLEEVPINQENTSQKVTTQGFGFFSENESSMCSLKSNFDFDNDITKKKRSVTMSSSPRNSHVPSDSKTFSVFGSGPGAGGGAHLTEKYSLRTPAFLRRSGCMGVPPPPSPLPQGMQLAHLTEKCSLQTPAFSNFVCVSAPLPPPPLLGGMKPACLTEKHSFQTPALPKVGACMGAPLSPPPLPQGMQLAHVTEKHSLQTPALTEVGACMGVPPPAPPLPGSAGSAPFCVDRIPHSILFGSPTPTYTFSDMTNVEKQVTPDCAVSQHHRKMKSTRAKCKKAAAKKERIQPKLEFTSVIWKEIFELQNQDGSWNLSPQLGKILKFDVDYLINHFLIRKGIQSLGINGKEKLLQLIATLLVLQFIRCAKKLKGIVFKSLMKLDNLTTSSDVHWAFELITKATEWVRRVEAQFPAICYRLELGKDWDSATKKILGIK
ncbi:PARP4 polymerase, partial [Penelope pileata]|nr:PARP4 polymerase [Penelope pileata]